MEEMIIFSTIHFCGVEIIVTFKAVDDTAPTTVNSTVTRIREYLTGTDVETLMVAARKSSRHGHRDATMTLIAYRHGLRASEVSDYARAVHRASSQRTRCSSRRFSHRPQPVIQRGKYIAAKTLDKAFSLRCSCLKAARRRPPASPRWHAKGRRRRC